MHAFMELTNAAKRIPHPGDIQLIAGGPPCQGVSGLNRHAKQASGNKGDADSLPCLLQQGKLSASVQ